MLGHVLASLEASQVFLLVRRVGISQRERVECLGTRQRLVGVPATFRQSGASWANWHMARRSPSQISLAVS